MNTLFRIIAVMAALSLLFACSNTSTNFDQDNDNNGRVVGSIHGVVSDTNTGARLKDITITYAVKGKIYTTKTNDLGYYAVNSLPSGSYELTFSGNSAYAISRSFIVIPDLEDIGISDIPTNDDFEYSVTQDRGLYTLDATVNGTIMAFVNGQEISDLTGIRVIADYGIYSFAPDIYTTYTDSDGVFAFAGLPSTGEFSLQIDSWTDGTHTFAAQDITVYPVVSGVLNLEPIYLDVVAEEVNVVSSNLYEFPITGTIEITFNQSIAPDYFDVELVNQSGGIVDISSIEWTSSTHVTIDPDEALLLDHTYDLNIDGMTVNANDFVWNTQFITQPGIMIESTNMELYDGYYQITPNKSIVINFTEQVLLGSANNVLDITDYPNPIMSWSNNNKTLTVTPPDDGYQTSTITVDMEFFSVLAPYDSVAMIYMVDIAE